MNTIAAGLFCLFVCFSGICTKEGFFRGEKGFVGQRGPVFTLTRRPPRRTPKGSDSASTVTRVWVFILTFPEVLSHGPIYNNRPLIVYRNNHTVTRRAESRSLLQPFFSLFSHAWAGFPSIF